MSWDTWVKDVFGAGMSWGEFTPGLIATVIGTLIGIFLPFYIQKKMDRKKEIKSAVQHLKNIKEELMSIKEKINHIDFEGNLYLNPIKTPVWDGLVNSSEINSLISYRKNIKRKKKTDDLNNGSGQDWYKLLFDIYSEIQEYNMWWNLYTDKYTSCDNIEDKGILNNILKALEEEKKFLCPRVENDETVRDVEELSITMIISLLESIV